MKPNLNAFFHVSKYREAATTADGKNAYTESFLGILRALGKDDDSYLITLRVVIEGSFVFKPMPLTEIETLLDHTMAFLDNNESSSS